MSITNVLATKRKAANSRIEVKAQIANLKNEEQYLAREAAFSHQDKAMVATSIYSLVKGLRTHNAANSGFACYVDDSASALLKVFDIDTKLLRYEPDVTAKSHEYLRAVQDYNEALSKLIGLKADTLESLVNSDRFDLINVSMSKLEKLAKKGRI